MSHILLEILSPQGSIYKGEVDVIILQTPQGEITILPHHASLFTKIIEGEIKKIVIVFTDGGSDDATRVQKALEKLRTVGVVIVCVAITESGSPALETYKPDGKLAETAEKLPLILGDALNEHLKDV